MRWLMEPCTWRQILSHNKGTMGKRGILHRRGNNIKNDTYLLTLFNNALPQILPASRKILQCKCNDFLYRLLWAARHDWCKSITCIELNVEQTWVVVVRCTWASDGRTGFDDLRVQLANEPEELHSHFEWVMHGCNVVEICRNHGTRLCCCRCSWHELG